MMVVIAVLAALGGAAVYAIGDMQERALSQVAQREMQELKRALLQFRQDTGYFPGTGPFALVAAATTENADGSCTPAPTGGGLRRGFSTDAWHVSPANLTQLFVAPQLCTNHPQASLAAWDMASGRGWRGPYLGQGAEGLVDVGDGLDATGTGSPSTIATSTLGGIRGVADPYLAAPVTAGGYGRCSESEMNTPAPTGACLLDWRSAVGVPTYTRWGRPYLAFDLADPSRARILSMGPDGRYDGVNATNACSANNDDHVLCLAR